jgi:integrase
MKGNGKSKRVMPAHSTEKPAGDDVQKQPEVPLFSGLSPHLSEVVKAFKDGSRSGQAESHPEDPLFSGLNVQELVKTLKPVFQPPTTSSIESSTQPSVPAPSQVTRLSNISTATVIESLLNLKKNKRAKESTIDTYKGRLAQFARKYPFLPLDSETIIDYLSQFGGETGRHRQNHQDLLKMLYDHAVRRFGLAKNPVMELERVLVTKKPIKTLSLDQALSLFKTPQTIMERVALELFLGHGWRQIEVRRVLVADVQAIENGLILCRGKEREELAPILPETAEGLKELSAELKPEDHIFRARQTRHGRRAPLGEDGMSQLIDRLFKRAGINGFKGHDLRRSFSTLVTAACGDDHLAMRLLRDSVPGLTNRYIRYPMELLVEALQKYSPLIQTGEETPLRKSRIKGKKLLIKRSPSSVSKTKKENLKAADERNDGLVETGEG